MARGTYGAGVVSDTLKLPAATPASKTDHRQRKLQTELPRGKATAA